MVFYIFFQETMHSNNLYDFRQSIKKLGDVRPGQHCSFIYVVKSLQSLEPSKENLDTAMFEGRNNQYDRSLEMIENG